MTGPSTSKSASAAKNSTTDSPRSKPAAVAKNSATVVISRPTPTPAPDLPPAYEDRYSLDPWRLKSRNVYKRRFRVEGKAVSCHYGLSDDNGHQPDIFFACRRQKSTWGFWVNFLCLRIVKELESHRKEQDRNCHCDFEYIRTGKTRRDTSRLCVWVPGKTGRFVWTGMREHDKHCSCGAFNFSNSRAT
ncbi:uncharacterized protein M437DRAFT_41769 [Aureobasidium melanogenum CBS 110374]|uniref:Uncharacterized protein n=1 Tax=Aureobasidium melanogenum (strain CBS 110374) TaxID=1043003 RepID=A0A074W6Q6_AURM1|nr:uncharacterized protein M437DRAFT_41769 [Aureobasidium melanogenum CBS 110374]KEQ65587.1 hypothetical protein M437DRAFT_41769 [Aureobasidium melanogenum CBS 110374]